MADEQLPPLGTRVVHKDDRAKTSGPVWEVVAHNTNPVTNGGKPIHLNHVRGHKLNTGLAAPPQPVKVSTAEFKDDYLHI